jgi:3-hydroxyisobutyrate dehydrogenase-like beta-hydroxyacid dehydrogenase
MSKDKIGFIGVGLMGHGMAKNIVEKGFALTVLGHRKREAIEDLKRRGAAEASSARDLAERSDIVFLCVTGSREVEAAVGGPNGLASAGKPLVIVDCSTSDPAITMKLAAELAEQHITLIDAPLGRTPKDALEGTLDVMVGGDDRVVARVRPVLDCFAGKVVHTGPTGTGHTMKLLNNFLSMGYGALYAEALALGAKVGLTPQVFDKVIRGGRMHCGFYDTYFKYVLEGDRNAHKFTINNGLKDTNYLASLAQAATVANPIGAAVRNSYAAAVANGKGEDYVPMLSDFIAAQNGVTLTEE